MSPLSIRRVVVLVTVAVLLIAGAEYAAGRIERDSAVKASERIQASQRLLTSMLDQETGSRGYFETNRTAFLAPWHHGGSAFGAALAASRRMIGGDPELVDELDAQAFHASAWHDTVATEIQRQRQTGRAPSVAEATADKATFDQFRAANRAYEETLIARRDSELGRANWLAAGLVAALTLLLVLLAVMLARRVVIRRNARADRQRELRELLQVSASESESQQLLIAHVQRTVPGAGAAVLHRNETEDRLDVALAAPSASSGSVSASPSASAPASKTTPTATERGAVADPLAGLRTDHLRRRSCMSVRLSRTYERGQGADPLLACDVCGRLAGEVACEPLLVGGRVIGSVLVAHPRKIGEAQRVELRESVVQSAPILANQRNLEVAEWRAASDPLTGLPNRRAAEEALRRMAAHAGRTLSPLGVLLLDLDRFKQINDRHGHDQGDKALTVIGQVLAASIRASDLAARYGGEEFLVLLPDTDRKGAVEVAEKIRYAIEHAEMPVIGSLTASFGVASLPEDAVEPELIVRKADRALYAAKARGRNRVEAALPSGADELGGDGDDLPGGGPDVFGGEA